MFTACAARSSPANRDQPARFPQVVHAPAVDRMDETECVLPAKLRSKARRAMSASGAVSGASGDLAGGSSDDNETPRQPPPAVALFEKVIRRQFLFRHCLDSLTLDLRSQLAVAVFLCGDHPRIESQ